jgi:trimeric autotransporter adhesin
MMAHVAGAATVTPRVNVDFNGTLSNLTYTLGAGELDTTGSFTANGSVAVGSGEADVPGNVDAKSGFYFDASSLGDLTTQDWLAEIVFSPDVAAAGQPGTFNNFLDIQGDTYFRYNGNGQPKAAEFGFFDGTNEPIDTTVGSLPTNRFSHLAVTWTAATNTLEAFLDGVSQGALASDSPFTASSTRIGFGFFARGGFIGRALDGKLDSVAFSTFTGTIDPPNDFQLTVPQPPLTATVNRDIVGSLGGIAISNNSESPFPIAGYSITSVGGALEQTNWSTVTGRLDAPGGNGGGDGSIDIDDDWVILSDENSESDLSEHELSFPGGNGGVLGVGESLDLGNVWRKVPGALEDVVVAVADAAGNVTLVPVSYTGNGGTSFLVGDLDFDGDVDLTDWQSYLAAAQSDLTGLTVAEQYRIGGNLNSDGASDLRDLDAFITSYEVLHGSGAFAALLASVPEPGTCVLLVCGLATLVRVRKRGVTMIRWHKWLFAAVVFGCVCWASSGPADAAAVTPRVFINFDGTANGAGIYTLGAGETDTSGTFRGIGAVSVSNGVADVAGDVNDVSGFFFNGNSLGLGTLTTQNWVTEAVFVPDVPVAQQTTHGAESGGARNNHILDVQGDTFYRFYGEDVAAEKITEFGYYDGTSELRTTTANLPTNKFSHVALVWDAANTSLEAFYDGVSQGVIDQNAFDVSSPYVGYGWFARYIAQPGVGPRSVDGKLDAVAFSTFTGSFVPGFGAEGDFQLDPSLAPSLVLNLKVNTVSGRTMIVNNTASAISIQGYEVSSALGSLNDGGWISLEDQNLDPVMGGDNPGETWQEGGNPSAQGLLEGFLLGSTTLAPGESLWLGNAYDASVAAQDLGFSYRRAGQSGIIDGLIEYDSTAPTGIDGDFNGNNIVDAADYTVWRNNLGSTETLLNDPTPGTVTLADYLVWKANFGKTFNSGAAAQSFGSPVPEPASTLLLAIALGVILWRFDFCRLNELRRWSVLVLSPRTARQAVPAGMDCFHGTR